MFSIRECHHLLDRTQELATLGFLPSQINCCTSDAEELHHLPAFYCCSICTIPPAWTDRLRAQKGLRQSVQGSNVWGFGQSSSEKSREGLSDGKSGCCRACAECDNCSVPGPAPWGHTGTVAGQGGALQTPDGETDSSKSSGLWILDLFQGW